MSIFMILLCVGLATAIMYDFYCMNHCHDATNFMRYLLSAALNSAILILFAIVMKGYGE